MILALLLLLQASVWAGDEAQECGQCHGAEAASQASTPMAQALQSVQDAKILRDHPNRSYSDGKYSYSIRREGGRSIYSVTDGTDAITAPITWAFGFGTMGQTYVFEPCREGRGHSGRGCRQEDRPGGDAPLLWLPLDGRRSGQPTAL